MTWTHNICKKCWDVREGEERTPVRLRDPQHERCCVCGDGNTDGIFFRCNPHFLPNCAGHKA